MFVLGIERGVIGIGFSHHLGDTIDAHRLRIAVIEQDAIAFFHVIAHEVARLVVAHAIPAGCAVTL